MNRIFVVTVYSTGYYFLIGSLVKSEVTDSAGLVGQEAAGTVPHLPPWAFCMQLLVSWAWVSM